jgi:alkanesulfonate monooxygenase SsuD/methylene tetrahydromethanopterin reductase-like flavin-dependent oxidoreductase (luciferase family)
MKIGLTLLFSRELPFGGEFVAFVARLAEELGFDSVWLPEHVLFPRPIRADIHTPRRDSPATSNGPTRWLA